MSIVSAEKICTGLCARKQRKLCGPRKLHLKICLAEAKPSRAEAGGRVLRKVSLFLSTQTGTKTTAHLGPVVMINAAIQILCSSRFVCATASSQQKRLPSLPEAERRARRAQSPEDLVTTLGVCIGVPCCSTVAKYASIILPIWLLLCPVPCANESH